MTRSALPGLAASAVLALAALVTGCAGTGGLGPRTAERPPAEVRELRERVLELQRRAAVSEVELDRLRRRVAELESRLGIESRPVPESRSSEAPSPAPGARTRPSADRPAARHEPVVEIEDITDEERPSPPGEPPPAVEERAPAPIRPVPPPSAPTPPAGAGGEVTAAAQALYDRGYTLYHQGRYVDAESSFQRFIQTYPETELTDNAQYWIGESRLARGDVRGALAAFRETVERHPRGNKVPDALLKVGEALSGIGDVEGAREAYREVTRRYPGTAAAAVAEDRLGELP